MTIPTWKKYFILFCGLLENLIFSGPIMGWSALNYMLKHERIYESICEYHFDSRFNGSVFMRDDQTANNSSENFAEKLANAVNNLLTAKLNNETNITFLNEMEAVSGSQYYVNFNGCTEQDKLLNLAYTIGTFCMGFTAFIWGFLLDKWGLRNVRLLINCLITGGVTLLCFTNRDRSHLIFPAVTLLTLAGVPLRIANMQFANLFPQKRSTVITFYSGAFSASAIIFVFLKYLFDYGLSFFMVSFLLVITSLLMLPVTFFLLPHDRIRDETESSSNIFSGKTSHLAIISPVTLERYTIISSPKLIKKSETDISKSDNKKDQYMNHITITSGCDQVKPKELPLKLSLYTWGFVLHQWWYSWLLTYMIMYVGSMNLWLGRVTTNLDQAGNYTKIYGLVQVSALILAPIAGLIMDHSIAKANRVTDPFDRKIRRIQAGFWPILFTTGTLVMILICRFFDTAAAVCISIVFITLLRSFIIAVASAYLRIRFHADHFNKLLGIMSTTGAFVTLLQFPLFVWESQSTSNVIWVNLFNCICTLVAILNPLHIIITPLQKHLILNEELKEKEVRKKQ